MCPIRFWVVCVRLETGRPRTRDATGGGVRGPPETPPCLHPFVPSTRVGRCSEVVPYGSPSRDTRRATHLWVYGGLGYGVWGDLVRIGVGLCTTFVRVTLLRVSGSGSDVWDLWWGEGPCPWLGGTPSTVRLTPCSGPSTVTTGLCGRAGGSVGTHLGANPGPR